MGSRASIAAAAACSLAVSSLQGHGAVLRAGRHQARQPDVDAYETLIQQPSFGSLFAGPSNDNLVKGLSAPSPAAAVLAAPAAASPLAPSPAVASSPSGAPFRSGGGLAGGGGAAAQVASQLVTIQYAVQGDYNAVVGSRKEVFLQECSATLQASAICSDVRPGSVVVDITGSAQSANTAVQAIEASPSRTLQLPSFAALPVVGVLSTVAASPGAVAALTAKYPELTTQVPNIGDIPFLVDPYAPSPAAAPVDPHYQAMADRLLVPPPLPGEVWPPIPRLPREEDIPVPPLPPPDPPAKPMAPPDPPPEGALVSGPPPGPVIEGEQPSSISAAGDAGATMLINVD